MRTIDIFEKIVLSLNIFRLKNKITNQFEHFERFNLSCVLRLYKSNSNR